MSLKGLLAERSGAGGFVPEGRFGSVALFWALAAFLILVVVFGGSRLSSGWRSLLVWAPAIALMGFVISQGAQTRMAGVPIAARLLLGAIIAVPIIQMLPLPPDLWQALPGREVQRSILQAIGRGDAWLPMTVSSNETLQAFLALVPPVAVLLGALLLNGYQVDRLLLVVAGSATVVIATGLVQIASGGEIANFYGGHKGLLLGFFANRNHAALFLAIVILITGHATRRYTKSRLQSAIVLGAIWFLLLCAIIGTASRTGFALGLLAILFSAGAGWVPGTRVSWRVLLAAVVGLVGLLALLQSSQVFSDVVRRFDSVGEDARWMFWINSMPIIREYLPFGTGLGTFRIVYERHEALEMLRSFRVNNAHNDYIEFLIEAGVVGAAIILAFLALLVQRLRSLSQDPIRRDRAILGAGIILLTLLHSVVDYPLRTPALAVLFALAVGMLFRDSVAKRESRSDPGDEPPSQPA